MISIIPPSNSVENSSMNDFEFCENISICRMCDSDIVWHLKPFSSRHCFWHIWQYHRSFCSPRALMRLAICFGARKPPPSLPMVATFTKVLTKALTKA